MFYLENSRATASNENFLYTDNLQGPIHSRRLVMSTQPSKNTSQDFLLLTWSDIDADITSTTPHVCCDGMDFEDAAAIERYVSVDNLT